ncbi:hypothetical protein H4Q26_002403 [Puccinia striiformis f. sp. tritici PST-130]|nr:hypothetical protein H4Q26_002403 [Puccinia striiformis f. sp. tritici PST-130]
MMKNINQQQHSHHYRAQANSIKTHSVSSISSEAEAEQLRVLSETKKFLNDRDTLTNVIDQSDQLIQRLNQFAQLHWSLVHPQLLNTLDLTTIELRFIKTSSIQQCSQHPCLDNLSSPTVEPQGSVQSHLADIRTRVLDRNSRILVTGDLNAGKSTFVNALLAREVAPTDQQPCTEVMCEILDGHISNLHSNRSMPFLMARSMISRTLPPIEDSGDDENPRALISCSRLHLWPRPRKARAEDGLKASNAISLLRQGDVSVSFIDSPGLNRDTLRRWSYSPNNPRSMSPRVLWAASQEKAYVFVVVNKWGGIRDKVKAERRIRDNFLEKILPRFNQLSANSHLVDETIGQIEENTVSLVYKNSRKILGNALKNIREGKLAQSSKSTDAHEQYFPVYDGILSIFQYAEEVRKVLLSSLEESVKLAENVARQSTAEAVEAIQ